MGNEAVTKPSAAGVINLAVDRPILLGRRSRRTAEIALRFGLSCHEPPTSIIPPTSVPVRPGSIVFITGPSGAGKSSLLAQLERQLHDGMNVGRVRFPDDVAVVDRILPQEPLARALSILSACALGEPRLWIRRYRELSDGERFRARLARAIGLGAHRSTSAPLLCDEFCSGLHRRIARAISHNLRKLARRTGRTFILASSQDDFVSDLAPDVVVQVEGRGRCIVRELRNARRRSFSLLRRLIVEQGCVRDYDEFAEMHYRGEYLGFVDKVFVLRDRRSRETLGVVVYAYSPLELSLRNRATGGRFIRKPQAVNRSFRIVRRLVVHPDLRGCGLGHRLLRASMPLVGTRYVECLSAMGEVNPVFTRAGMACIGVCPDQPARMADLAELRRLGVDPDSSDFIRQVCRRRRVREVVARAVYEWYRATTAGGERRVARQSPEQLGLTFRSLVGARPVYYLWDREA